MGGGFGTIGTVGQDQTLPASALYQSVIEQAPASSKNSAPGTLSNRETARILRQHRLDELLDSIHAWGRSTCIERAYWRSTARWQLAEFRRLHLHPERRAFEAAIAASQHRRTA